MMVTPVLIGATFATFALGVGDYFDSFTGGLFKGSLSAPMMFWICMAPSIDICSTHYVLRKGGTILVTKVGMGILTGVMLTAILVPPVAHWWAMRVQSTTVSPGAISEPPGVGGVGDLSGMPTAKE